MMFKLQSQPWRRRVAAAMSVAAASVGLGLAMGRATAAPAAPAEPAIQVNQVGFVPAAAKWAAVPLAPGQSAPAVFRVVDADNGRLVWQGPLGEAADWSASGQRLALADFSALQRSGRYRVVVDGLPPSASFRVAPDAYAALNAAAIKAFYFNRASIELKPEHAGRWARPAGHPDTQVRVHASAASPGRPEGTLISAPKGWYDAGDYNKYIVNSGITMHALLAAWEQFPQFFRAQKLGLPESGNGLPDLLNEVQWNLDWMLAMQDPADGGVYHKLTNKGFDGVVMPHQATSERYVVAKGTAATLDFAAVTAMAARVFRAFEAQRPGYAGRLLAASRRAWAWAQAHPNQAYRQPPDIHTGGYDDDRFADEFGWAAAELFITTGEPSYWQAMAPEQLAMTVPGWSEVSGLAWISLAHHRQRLHHVADRALIQRRLGGLASHLAAAWQTSPERLGVTGQDYAWGSNAALLNRAMVLIQSARLGGPSGHLDAAQALLDHALGRNALATSWVTGFGERSAQHPHHRPSEADGVPEPVPGFLVGGPNGGTEDAKGCPVPYASTLPARAWLDHFCSYASNEVAINWNAPLVYVSAALQVLRRTQ